jgi:hypothetical protein
MRRITPQRGCVVRHARGGGQTPYVPAGRRPHDPRHPFRPPHVLGQVRSPGSLSAPGRPLPRRGGRAAGALRRAWDPTVAGGRRRGEPVGSTLRSPGRPRHAPRRRQGQLGVPASGVGCEGTAGGTHPGAGAPARSRGVGRRPAPGLRERPATRDRQLVHRRSGGVQLPAGHLLPPRAAPPLPGRAGRHVLAGQARLVAATRRPRSHGRDPGGRRLVATSVSGCLHGRRCAAARRGALPPPLRRTPDAGGLVGIPRALVPGRGNAHSAPAAAGPRGGRAAAGRGRPRAVPPACWPRSGQLYRAVRPDSPSDPGRHRRPRPDGPAGPAADCRVRNGLREDGGGPELVRQAVCRWPGRRPVLRAADAGCGTPDPPAPAPGGGTLVPRPAPQACHRVGRTGISGGRRSAARTAPARGWCRPALAGRRGTRAPRAPVGSRTPQALPGRHRRGGDGRSGPAVRGSDRARPSALGLPRPQPSGRGRSARLGHLHGAPAGSPPPTPSRGRGLRPAPVGDAGGPRPSPLPGRRRGRAVPACPGGRHPVALSGAHPRGRQHPSPGPRPSRDQDGSLSSWFRWPSSSKAW